MFEFIKKFFAHCDGVERVCEKLAVIETNLANLKEYTMATVQDLLDAAAAEKVEVDTKLNALAAEVQALKDQIAQGGTITETQLDSVLTGIQGITTTP
jgi:hypothetical protein